MPYGVGVLGAGPGAAALHLPTLARLVDRLDVVHIADGGSGKAERLAAGVGAHWSSGEDDLLGDPAVEVVAICSPPEHHARQVRKAVAAGKRAIFCEKPIATTIPDADSAIEACRAAGTALLVGTNHFFDAAWGRAKHHLVARSGRVQAVTVTLALPPNGRYHDLVTEGGPFTGPNRGRPDVSRPEVAASVVRALIAGLAVHEIPALRDLAPVLDEVVYAQLVEPVGYVVGYLASGVHVRLATVMLPEGADALWRVSIVTADDRIDVEFPPAFVHAGSARVTVRWADGRTTVYRRDAQDGYIAEWAALATMLDDDEPVEYDELLADARYVIELADAAAQAVVEGMRR